MTEKERNDYFYVCSLIEYIARETKNKRGVIASALGLDGLEKQLHDAEVNHCLSFEQVSDELIEQYQIPIGNFDTISDCKYTIPSFLISENSIVFWQLRTAQLPEVKYWK